jgi:predicted DNA-binding transcriptional regulator YafY
MARFRMTLKGKQWFTPEEEEAADAVQAEWEAGADDRAAEEVRNKRNALLTESDWTQVADAPVDAKTWATYRQALRDITTHANFPNLEDTDWPVKP